MKLVVNIPAYNEEEHLPIVLKQIPKKIAGISAIEVQVIDDGSTDNTYAVAKKYGCRVIRQKQNLGLGNAFKLGMETALEHGCDIFVNTDADNQYPGKYIPSLIKPIMNNEADIVIGNREPWNVAHFSYFKRIAQYFGNLITRTIAGSDVPDTVSGFRAYSREALLRLNVMTRFSYVLDTIIQASKKGMKIVSIPIKVNEVKRKSRLFKSSFHHIRATSANILRLYAIYEPFKTFLVISMIFFIPAMLLTTRFLVFYFDGSPGGHIQSLIAAAILYLLGGLMFVLGVIADLIGINRRLNEEQSYLQKKEYYGRK